MMDSNTGKVVGIVAILVALLFFGGGGGGTPTTTTTTTVKTTTTAKTTTTVSVPLTSPLPGVKRFFADSVVWNRPTAEFGVDQALTNTYAPRLFLYAAASGWPDLPNTGRVPYDPSKNGNWDVALRDYSVPIWDARKATMTIRVFKSVDAQSQGVAWNNVKIGDTIPWNPTWKLGTGLDGIAAIVNFDTGETWELYRPVGSREPFNCFDFFGPNFQAGFDINNATHTCWGGITKVPNVFTASSTLNTRGMGINKLALITRADEVESGVIRHALELTTFNSMIGPACATNSVFADGAGIACGVFIPPATRIEHMTFPHNNKCGVNEFQASTTTRSRTIPQGMRFRLNITDSEITQWLDSRKFSGPIRNTARVFAVALRDYGFYPGAETGCNQPLIETDGMQNPEAKQKWKNLGLIDSGYDQDGDGLPDFPSGDLLYGLFTQTRLQVVNAG